MSLLLFNGGSRIAQGVLKRLQASGNYERIVCADVYPNYQAIHRALRSREEIGLDVNTKTKIEDIKISERSDLVEAVNGASHVVYVTHDYYTLAAAQSNLLKTTAEIAKNNRDLKKLVYLLPNEYNHQGELNEIKEAERQAQETYPDLVKIKTDIVAGENGGVLNELLRRIVNGESIYFNPRRGEEQAAPVHSDDVSSAVEKALKDDKLKGKGYLLQGNERLRLSELVNLLEEAANKKASLNSSTIESVFSPTSVNLLTEKLYTPEYINIARFLSNYQSVSETGLEKISELGIQAKSVKGAYKSVATDKLIDRSSTLEKAVKGFLYY